MLPSSSILTSSAALALSLNMATAFWGCCDDPPPEPQPPPPQPVTETMIHIDIPDIASKLKPGQKCIIKTATKNITANSNLSLEGLEITGRVEVEGSFTHIYLQKLIAQLRKLLKAPGFSGGGSGPITPNSLGDAPAPLPHHQPFPMFRHWISAPIETVPFSPHVVQSIENDPYQTPIRFAFAVPFGTADEFFDAGIDSFWVDAFDANGQSVMPSDVILVSTPIGEWPLTSRIIWDPSDPPVICVSFDLLNADWTMVTPTQLGCDVQPVTFKFGMTTTDTTASWDFAWSASLWRTELDEVGTHHGDGGMWLGWHASSFENTAPINGLPLITQVTDDQGNPTTTFARGDLLSMTVADGLPEDDVEISCGGRVITDILASTPGPGRDEMTYVFQVPLNSEVGDWSLFHRNLGATPRTHPNLVPEIQAGYDYMLLTIQ